MNCTPKVRQKKSNFWGIFIMKLTYEDKVQIYELRKQGKNRYLMCTPKVRLFIQVEILGFFNCFGNSSEIELDSSSSIFV